MHRSFDSRSSYAPLRVAVTRDDKVEVGFEAGIVTRRRYFPLDPNPPAFLLDTARSSTTCTSPVSTG
jgi:hypothetical protein